MADGGLLDFIKTPEGQGLLAATFGGLAGAQRGAPINSLGRAGLAGLQGYGGALDRNAQQAEAAQMNKYRQAQIDDFTQRTAREKMANEKAARKKEALPGLFTGGQQALAPLIGDAETGILPSAGRPSVAPVLDWQRGLDAGYSPDELVKLGSLPNIGKQEVARTIKGTGSDGREYEYQIDKFGQKIGDGFGQWKAPIEVGQGDRKTFVDPSTGAEKFGFQVNQSPDSKASNALGWANNATTERGQNMTDARARDLNAIKRNEVTSVKDQAKSSQLASFDTMLGTLGRLSDHPGLSRSVGAIGAFPTMPGSESANFKAELDTFQSQAFLPMVSQLKGMGALSDAEGKKITAAVGALNPNMGEKAFRESIKRITADMNSARDRLSGIHQPAPPAQEKPVIPMKGMVQGGYKFKGGDASNPSNWEKQ